MHRYGLCCAVLCVWHYVIQQRGSSSSKHVMWFPKMCFFKRSMNLSQSTKQYDYAWSILVYSLITDSNCTWSRSSHIARCVFVRSFARTFVHSLCFLLYSPLNDSPWIFRKCHFIMYMFVWHQKCYVHNSWGGGGGDSSNVDACDNGRADDNFLHTLHRSDQIRSDRIRVFRKILCYLSASFYFRV